MTRTDNEWMYWRAVWLKAVHNMPYIRQQQRSMGLYGQQSALGHCLGYASRCHHAVWSGYIRGSKPKGKRATSLQMLAGPHGPVFARMKLMRLGILSRYKGWPK